MKKRLIILCIIAMSSLKINAQVTTYKVLPDPKHPNVKMLVGLITKYAMANDTTMSWYAKNQKYFNPKAELVAKFAAAKDVQYVVFGGTWCEDTQVILPSFFKLQDMAGIADNRITLFGVDRDKKTISAIASAFGITNAPTIIAMKNGKEIGRVIEYGTKGDWSAELAEIINK